MSELEEVKKRAEYEARVKNEMRIELRSLRNKNQEWRGRWLNAKKEIRRAVYAWEAGRHGDVYRILRNLLGIRHNKAPLSKAKPANSIYDLRCESCGTQLNYRETQDQDGNLLILVQSCDCCREPGAQALEPEG